MNSSSTSISFQSWIAALMLFTDLLIFEFGKEVNACTVSQQDGRLWPLLRCFLAVGLNLWDYVATIAQHGIVSILVAPPMVPVTCSTYSCKCTVLRIHDERVVAMKFVVNDGITSLEYRWQALLAAATRGPNIKISSICDDMSSCQTTASPLLLRFLRVLAKFGIRSYEKLAFKSSEESSLLESLYIEL